MFKELDKVLDLRTNKHMYVRNTHFNGNYDLITLSEEKDSEFVIIADVSEVILTEEVDA